MANPEGAGEAGLSDEDPPWAVMSATMTVAMAVITAAPIVCQRWSFHFLDRWFPISPPPWPVTGAPPAFIERPTGLLGILT